MHNLTLPDAKGPLKKQSIVLCRSDHDVFSQQFIQCNCTPFHLYHALFLSAGTDELNLAAGKNSELCHAGANLAVAFDFAHPEFVTAAGRGQRCGSIRL